MGKCIAVALLAAVPGLLFAQAPRFTGNGDGTATDNLTGLTWQQDGKGDMVQGWQSTLQHCQDLTLGGRTDWRLPNVKELSSIVMVEKGTCAVDENYFTVWCGGTQYITSTTKADQPDQAWYVTGDGAIGAAPKGNWFHVRCARGG